MPLKLIIISAVLLISTGSYFGYQKYLNPNNSSNQNIGNSQEEKLKQELETKNSELKEINTKLENLQKQFEEYKTQTDVYKKQITSKDAEISILNKKLGSKESDLNKLDSKLSKQEYCNKMNEYSQLSSELKFRYNGESGGNGCSSGYASHISSNTENAYDYINEWYKNYKSTGSFYYKHNPDVCLYDVEKLMSKLKERRDKYREYKEKCN